MTAPMPATTDATVTTLLIQGTPAPQGSKVAVPIWKGSKKKGNRQFTGKAVVLEQTRETLDPWRTAVEKQAREQYRGIGPLNGDLSVGMVFAMQRKKTVRRPYPSVYPDLSKLARAVEDSLTDAGVWVDDALAVRYHLLAKVYAGGPYMGLELEGVPELTEPGVWIQIRYVGAVPVARRVAPRQGRPDPKDVRAIGTHRGGDVDGLTDPFRYDEVA